ncbi:MAG TPA: glycosyltransferase family 4 protein [Acidimicrobiales bacterium]|nr:glycosyltransferase family 4 protein [Acidimicrobiales bacterium]
MTTGDRPLQVTWLGHGAERTGPPIYLLRILEGLQAHPEIEPSVVLLDDGPLLPELAALAPTTVVRPPPLTGLRRAATAGLSRLGASRSAAALAEGRTGDAAPGPDVVVVNTAGSIAALPALGAPPRRLISHVHELATGLDYWLAPELRRQVLEDSDEIWVVADAVGRHLVEDHGVDAARLRTHRGVLPSDAFTPLDPAERDRRRADLGVPPGHLLVGASGTLDWRKASDHFLEAAHRTAASAVPIHLVWIGGDPSTPWGRLLVEQAEAAGLADRVRLIAEGDRPDRWFGALDLFLLPSREDAYPLVCMEAAAAGVPLVAFDSGGAGELVRDGGGVVVPYPDAAALAAEVERFARDEAGRRAAGDAARAAAERHTIEAALPSLIADLQRVAAS